MEEIIKTLDMLGLALADENHVWTNAERKSYENAITLFKKTDERVQAFTQLAEEILVSGAYKATKYLGEKLTIKATRKRYKGKIIKNHTIDIVFTVGPPNYEEREKIKMAKKKNLGPIEMTLKFPPKGK